MFGYTPYSYDPSSQLVDSPFTKPRGGYRGHKSVFTYRGLKKLLELHKFNVIYEDGFTYANESLAGVGVSAYKIRKIIDKCLPKGLKEGILLGCKKI